MDGSERLFLAILGAIFLKFDLVEAQAAGGYGGTFGGYGGALGGYSLAGSLSNFYGNCTTLVANTTGGYGSSYYGGGGYGNSNNAASTSYSSAAIPNCGFDADSAKVFGYYGYDFPKPPIGITYPNIGWPYSIPNPYYTPPPYGPIGIPYYGVPVAGYNPYLWGYGSYNGIYGAARGGIFAIPEEVPSYIPSGVKKGYKFGPGGQIIAWY